MPEPKEQQFANSLRHSTSYMLKRCQQIFETLLEAEQFGAPFMLGQIHFEMLVASCALQNMDQAALGRSIGINKSTVTAAVDTLEKLRLLNRRLQQDRRRRYLVPSKKAQPAIEFEFDKRKRAAMRLLAPLSEDEQAAFLAALMKLAGTAGTSAPDWDIPEIDAAQTQPAVGRLLFDAYNNPGFLLRRCCQIGRGFILSSLPVSEFTEGQAKMLYLVCAVQRTDMATLQHAFAAERPTLLIILKNLTERGFVEQSRDPADRRRKLVSPTAAGNEAMKSMLGVWEEIEGCISDRLSKSVYLDLRELLVRITEGHGDGLS